MSTQAHDELLLTRINDNHGDIDYLYSMDYDLLSLDIINKIVRENHDLTEFNIVHRSNKLSFSGCESIYVSQLETNIFGCEDPNIITLVCDVIQRQQVQFVLSNKRFIGETVFHFNPTKTLGEYTVIVANRSLFDEFDWSVKSISGNDHESIIEFERCSAIINMDNKTIETKINNKESLDYFYSRRTVMNDILGINKRIFSNFIYGEVTHE